MWRASFLLNRALFSAPRTVPFIARTFISPAIDVTMEQMRSLEQWPKEESFELMFATKRGLPLPRFPIFHSAIALYNARDNTFSIYGRQSPYGIATLFRHGLKFFTEKDNEKDYLSLNFNFKAYPTGVHFNKDEIKGFLDKADELINKGKVCNMVNSNCYSYSTTAMVLAIETLLLRESVCSAEISRIISTIDAHPLNDHCSFGVLNNEIVVEQLLSVFEKVKLKFTPGATPLSTDDQSLYKQTCGLIEKITEESQKYRILSLVNTL